MQQHRKGQASTHNKCKNATIHTQRMQTCNKHTHTNKDTTVLTIIYISNKYLCIIQTGKQQHTTTKMQTTTSETKTTTTNANSVQVRTIKNIYQITSTHNTNPYTTTTTKCKQQHQKQKQQMQTVHKWSSLVWF